MDSVCVHEAPIYFFKLSFKGNCTPNLVSKMFIFQKWVIFICFPRWKKMWQTLVEESFN